MIRSASAASAHLAEIPVPAPAPMMGVPAALLACHRFRHAARSIVPLLPFASLDHDATIRLPAPNSKKKCRTGRDLRCVNEKTGPILPAIEHFAVVQPSCFEPAVPVN